MPSKCGTGASHDRGFSIKGGRGSWRGASASAAAEQYRANLVTNYQFSKETFLRSWSVGAGVRWQSKLGIDYPAAYNPDGTVDLGIDRPFYAPAETNVDLNVA